MMISFEEASKTWIRKEYIYEGEVIAPFKELKRLGDCDSSPSENSFRPPRCMNCRKPLGSYPIWGGHFCSLECEDEFVERYE